MLSSRTLVTCLCLLPLWHFGMFMFCCCSRSVALSFSILTLVEASLIDVWNYSIKFIPWRWRCSCFVYLWSMLLAMFTFTCFPTPTRRVEFDQWLVSPIRWVDLCQRLSFIIIGSVQLRKCYATLSASTMLHGA